MSYAGGQGDYGLETLGSNGAVPQTRMKKASNVVDFAQRLRQNDEKRAWKRSRVDGLVGGNPPYRQSKLREAGMAANCNVNWGTSRMYMESGSGAFYDLFSEAPGTISIQTSHGTTAEERNRYSTILSEQADKLLAEDESWDYEMQQSQDQMVLHGRGPLFFEDCFKVFPRSVHDGDLRVPERTKADTKYWEVATIEMDYYPPELYKFIEDEQAASTVGWNVKFTQEVISNAMDIRTPDNRIYEWEFYQQEIKNNSLSYYDDSKVCHVVHTFWKEFNGRITHAIVERSAQTQSEPQYLFISVGRFASFKECVHPMYFDRGNGGFHHSVTGLGVKMYGPMEYENRLMCNLMDKTFAPKVLFRPTSAEAKQKMEISHMGDYGVLPAGWDVEQVPIQGFLTDGLAMWRASSELMRSNLSNYRQQVAMRESGNPATAREVTLKASEQSSLSKPTYSRYYKQLDMLYTEMVRRMCNLNTLCPRAKLFQDRCIEKGVPREAFGRVETVRAVRVIGQGSPYMRQQSVSSIGQIMQRLPEDGQQNWINDFIAANAGQSAVERYNPQASVNRLPDDQHYEALQGVAMMKIGMPPIVTSSQNPVIYAATYLKAATQALQSLQQGASLMDVMAFLDICGPCIMAQLQRFANDPLRSQIFGVLSQQWKKLSQITDQLRRQLQSQQQQQQQLQQKAQTVQSEAEIKAMKAKADMDLKAQKQNATLQMQAEKHRQGLAISDAKTASEIDRANKLAQVKMIEQQNAAAKKESE